jgi:Ethanolamine utilization protein EutJ (predicted chaperonin)
MFGMSMDIGVDLGTATVLVYIKGKGIVLREPSVVAIDRDTNRIIAIGEEARRMLGRTPGNIVAIRPLREGVIADYDTTESMLRHFIEKVAGRSMFFKPRIMVCVPSGVTDVERRALIEVAEEAGAKHASLIEEPVAAAIGAGIDIGAPTAVLIKKFRVQLSFGHGFHCAITGQRRVHFDALMTCFFHRRAHFLPRGINEFAREKSPVAEIKRECKFFHLCAPFQFLYIRGDRTSPQFFSGL